MRRLTRCTLILAAFVAIREPTVARSPIDPAELFESRIRPLLVEHCFECHAGDTAEGGLRLDSQAGFAAGGDSGPVIDKAEPDKSLLLQLVRHEVADREMPQGADRLADHDIALALTGDEMVSRVIGPGFATSSSPTAIPAATSGSPTSTAT